MAHAQKPDLVFQRNGRVHLYRRGCQFIRLLAAEVCASAVVMLDRPCPIQCTTAGYPLHSPFSPSLLHPCVSVCHHIPFLLYQGKWTSWVLANYTYYWTLKEGCTWRQIPAKVIHLYILEESTRLCNEDLKYYFTHLISSVSLISCVIENVCMRIWIQHKKKYC